MKPVLKYLSSEAENIVIFNSGIDPVLCYASKPSTDNNFN